MTGAATALGVAILVGMSSIAFSPSASAQAGPPLITNDPDTPGPGAWEINVAATGARVGQTLDLDAPDIDINHGVGEGMQLSLHVPWAHRYGFGDGWASGAGPVEFGVRWRFVDQSQAGVSMAIQPMWITSFSHVAEKKGLAPVHAEFVLPLQVARHLEKAALGGEVARHFVSGEPDVWQAGVFAEYDCRARIQCLAEINTLWDGGANTIVNVGGRATLTRHVNLLGSLGRQVTGRVEDRARFVFYLGAQFVF